MRLTSVLCLFISVESKKKYLSKNLKPNGSPKNLKPNGSPKNLVVFTHTKVLGQLIQQIDQMPQQQVRYHLEKYHSNTDSICGIYRALA